MFISLTFYKHIHPNLDAISLTNIKHLKICLVICEVWVIVGPFNFLYWLVLKGLKLVFFKFRIRLWLLWKWSKYDIFQFYKWTDFCLFSKISGYNQIWTRDILIVDKTAANEKGCYSGYVLMHTIYSSDAV